MSYDAAGENKFLYFEYTLKSKLLHATKADPKQIKRVRYRVIDKDNKACNLTLKQRKTIQQRLSPKLSQLKPKNMVIKVLAEDNFSVILDAKETINITKREYVAESADSKISERNNPVIEHPAADDPYVVILEKIKTKTWLENLRDYFQGIANFFYKPTFPDVSFKKRLYGDAVKEDYRSLRKALESGHAWLTSASQPTEANQVHTRSVLATNVKNTIENAKSIERALGKKNQKKALDELAKQFTADIMASKDVVVPTGYMNKQGALQPVMARFYERDGTTYLEIYSDAAGPLDKVSPVLLRALDNNCNEEHLRKLLNSIFSPLLSRTLEANKLAKVTKPSKTFETILETMEKKLEQFQIPLPAASKAHEKTSKREAKAVPESVTYESFIQSLDKGMSSRWSDVTPSGVMIKQPGTPAARVSKWFSYLIEKEGGAFTTNEKLNFLVELTTDWVNDRFRQVSKKDSLEKQLRVYQECKDQIVHVTKKIMVAIQGHTLDSEQGQKIRQPLKDQEAYATRKIEKLTKKIRAKAVSMSTKFLDRTQSEVVQIPFRREDEVTLEATAVKEEKVVVEAKIKEKRNWTLKWQDTLSSLSALLSPKRLRQHQAQQIMLELNKAMAVVAESVKSGPQVGEKLNNILHGQWESSDIKEDAVETWIDESCKRTGPYQTEYQNLLKSIKEMGGITNAMEEEQLRSRIFSLLTDEENSLLGQQKTGIPLTSPDQLKDFLFPNGALDPQAFERLVNCCLLETNFAETIIKEVRVHIKDFSMTKEQLAEVVTQLILCPHLLPQNIGNPKNTIKMLRLIADPNGTFSSNSASCCQVLRALLQLRNIIPRKETKGTFETTVKGQGDPKSALFSVQGALQSRKERYQELLGLTESDAVKNNLVLAIAVMDSRLQDLETVDPPPTFESQLKILEAEATKQSQTFGQPSKWPYYVRTEIMDQIEEMKSLTRYYAYLANEQTQQVITKKFDLISGFDGTPDKGMLLHERGQADTEKFNTGFATEVGVLTDLIHELKRTAAKETDRLKQRVLYDEVKQCSLKILKMLPPPGTEGAVGVPSVWTHMTKENRKKMLHNVHKLEHLVWECQMKLANSDMSGKERFLLVKAQAIRLAIVRVEVQETQQALEEIFKSVGGDKVRIEEFGTVVTKNNGMLDFDWHKVKKKDLGMLQQFATDHAKGREVPNVGYLLFDNYTLDTEHVNQLLTQDLTSCLSEDAEMEEDLLSVFHFIVRDQNRGYSDRILPNNTLHDQREGTTRFPFIHDETPGKNPSSKIDKKGLEENVTILLDQMQKGEFYFRTASDPDYTLFSLQPRKGRTYFQDEPNTLLKHHSLDLDIKDSTIEVVGDENQHVADVFTSGREGYSLTPGQDSQDEDLLRPKSPDILVTDNTQGIKEDQALSDIRTHVPFDKCDAYALELSLNNRLLLPSNILQELFKIRQEPGDVKNRHTSYDSTTAIRALAFIIDGRNLQYLSDKSVQQFLADSLYGPFILQQAFIEQPVAMLNLSKMITPQIEAAKSAGNLEAVGFLSNLISQLKLHASFAHKQIASQGWCCGLVNGSLPRHLDKGGGMYQKIFERKQGFGGTLAAYEPFGSDRTEGVDPVKAIQPLISTIGQIKECVDLLTAADNTINGEHSDTNPLNLYFREGEKPLIDSVSDLKVKKRLYAHSLRRYRQMKVEDLKPQDYQNILTGYQLLLTPLDAEHAVDSHQQELISWVREKIIPPFNTLNEKNIILNSFLAQRLAKEKIETDQTAQWLHTGQWEQKSSDDYTFSSPGREYSLDLRTMIIEGEGLQQKAVQKTYLPNAIINRSDVRQALKIDGNIEVIKTTLAGNVTIYQWEEKGKKTTLPGEDKEEKPAQKFSIIDNNGHLVIEREILEGVRIGTYIFNPVVIPKIENQAVALVSDNGIWLPKNGDGTTAFIFEGIQLPTASNHYKVSVANGNIQQVATPNGHLVSNLSMYNGVSPVLFADAKRMITLLDPKSKKPVEMRLKGSPLCFRRQDQSWICYSGDKKLGKVKLRDKKETKEAKHPLVSQLPLNELDAVSTFGDNWDQYVIPLETETEEIEKWEGKVKGDQKKEVRYVLLPYKQDFDVKGTFRADHSEIQPMSHVEILSQKEDKTIKGSIASELYLAHRFLLQAAKTKNSSAARAFLMKADEHLIKIQGERPPTDPLELKSLQNVVKLIQEQPPVLLEGMPRPEVLTVSLRLSLAVRSVREMSQRQGFETLALSPKDNFQELETMSKIYQAYCVLKPTFAVFKPEQRHLDKTLLKLEDHEELILQGLWRQTFRELVSSEIIGYFGASGRLQSRLEIDPPDTLDPNFVLALIRVAKPAVKTADIRAVDRPLRLDTLLENFWSYMISIKENRITQDQLLFLYEESLLPFADSEEEEIRLKKIDKQARQFLIAMASLQQFGDPMETAGNALNDAKEKIIATDEQFFAFLKDLSPEASASFDSVKNAINALELKEVTEKIGDTEIRYPDLEDFNKKTTPIEVSLNNFALKLSVMVSKAENFIKEHTSRLQNLEQNVERCKKSLKREEEALNQTMEELKKPKNEEKKASLELQFKSYQEKVEKAKQALSQAVREAEEAPEKKILDPVTFQEVTVEEIVKGNYADMMQLKNLKKAAKQAKYLQDELDKQLSNIERIKDAVSFQKKIEEFAASLTDPNLQPMTWFELPEKGAAHDAVVRIVSSLDTSTLKSPPNVSFSADEVLSLVQELGPVNAIRFGKHSATVVKKFVIFSTPLAAFVSWFQRQDAKPITVKEKRKVDAPLPVQDLCDRLQASNYFTDKEINKIRDRLVGMDPESQKSTLEKLSLALKKSKEEIAAQVGLGSYTEIQTTVATPNRPTSNLSFPNFETKRRGTFESYRTAYKHPDINSLAKRLDSLDKKDGGRTLAQTVTWLPTLINGLENPDPIINELITKLQKKIRKKASTEEVNEELQKYQNLLKRGSVEEKKQVILKSHKEQMSHFISTCEAEIRKLTHDENFILPKELRTFWNMMLAIGDAAAAEDLSEESKKVLDEIPKVFGEADDWQSVLSAIADIHSRLGGQKMVDVDSLALTLRLIEKTLPDDKTSLYAEDLKKGLENLRGNDPLRNDAIISEDQIDYIEDNIQKDSQKLSDSLQEQRAEILKVLKSASVHLLPKELQKILLRHGGDEELLAAALKEYRKGAFDQSNLDKKRETFPHSSVDPLLSVDELLNNYLIDLTRHDALTKGSSSALNSVQELHKLQKRKKDLEDKLASFEKLKVDPQLQQIVTKTQHMFKKGVGGKWIIIPKAEIANAENELKAITTKWARESNRIKDLTDRCQSTAHLENLSAKLKPHARKIIYLQSRLGIVLRQNQIDTLSEIIEHPSLLKQLRMGLGKTSVILPFALEILAAEGYNPIGMVPKALFDTNFKEMDEVTRLVFELAGNQFRFNREDATEPFDTTNLHLISQKCTAFLSALERGEFILTTIESKASLDDKIVEVLRSKSELIREIKKLKEDEKANKKSIDGKYEEVVRHQIVLDNLLRVKGVFENKKTRIIVDEIDQVARSNYAVNSEVGKKEAPSQLLRDTVSTIFDIILREDDLSELRKQICANNQFTLQKEEIDHFLKEIGRVWIIRNKKQLAPEMVEPLLAWFAGGKLKGVDTSQIPETFLVQMKAMRKGLNTALRGSLALKIGLNGEWDQTHESLGVPATQGVTSKTTKYTDPLMQLSSTHMISMYKLQGEPFLKSAAADVLYAIQIRAKEVEKQIAKIEQSQKDVLDLFLTDQKRFLTDEMGLLTKSAQKMETLIVQQRRGNPPIYTQELKENDGVNLFIRQKYAEQVALRKLIYVSENQISRPVQHALRGCNVIGLSGTATRNTEHVIASTGHTKGMQSVLDAGRQSSAEVNYRLVKALPQGLDTPVKTYSLNSEEELNHFKEFAKKGSGYNFLVNQAGACDTFNLFQIVTALHEADKRPIVFMNINKEGSYKSVMIDGEIKKLDDLSSKDKIKVQENGFYYYHTPHVRGTHFDIPTGSKGALMLSPTANASDRDQAAYRARELGEGHIVELFISKNQEEELAKKYNKPVITIAEVLKTHHNQTQEDEKKGDLAAYQLHVQGLLPLAADRALAEIQGKALQWGEWMKKEDRNQHLSQFNANSVVFDAVEKFFVNNTGNDAYLSMLDQELYQGGEINTKKYLDRLIDKEINKGDRLFQLLQGMLSVEDEALNQALATAMTQIAIGVHALEEEKEKLAKNWDTEYSKQFPKKTPGSSQSVETAESETTEEVRDEQQATSESTSESTSDTEQQKRSEATSVALHQIDKRLLKGVKGNFKGKYVTHHLHHLLSDSIGFGQQPQQWNGWSHHVKISPKLQAQLDSSFGGRIPGIMFIVVQEGKKNLIVAVDPTEGIYAASPYGDFQDFKDEKHGLPKVFTLQPTFTTIGDVELVYTGSGNLMTEKEVQLDRTVQAEIYLTLVFVGQTQFTDEQWTTLENYWNAIASDERMAIQNAFTAQLKKNPALLEQLARHLWNKPVSKVVSLPGQPDVVKFTNLADAQNGFNAYRKSIEKMPLDLSKEVTKWADKNVDDSIRESFDNWALNT